MVIDDFELPPSHAFTLSSNYKAGCVHPHGLRPPRYGHGQNIPSLAPQLPPSP